MFLCAFNGKMSVVDLIKLAKDDIENPEDKKRIWIRVVCKIIVHIINIKIKGE